MDIDTVSWGSWFLKSFHPGAQVDMMLPESPIRSVGRKSMAR